MNDISKTMNSLNLPNVTLVACTTRDHIDTLLALNHTYNLINFKNILYFSDINPWKEYPFMVQRLRDFTYIPCQKFKEYWDVCIWFMTDFPKYKYLFADHIMSIHHDGYPIRPNAWSDEFLDYHFIGAPWIWGGVGNNGFCIYSKKLIKIIEEQLYRPVKEECHPSDMVIFNNQQRWSEDYGIKFAPFDLAKKFAVEGHRYDQSLSLGFHGIYNLVGVDKFDDVIVPPHHQHIVTSNMPHRYSPIT